MAATPAPGRAGPARVLDQLAPARPRAHSGRGAEREVAAEVAARREAAAAKWLAEAAPAGPAGPSVAPTLHAVPGINSFSSLALAARPASPSSATSRVRWSRVRAAVTSRRTRTNVVRNAFPTRPTPAKKASKRMRMFETS